MISSQRYTQSMLCLTQNYAKQRLKDVHPASSKRRPRAHVSLEHGGERAVAMIAYDQRDEERSAELGQSAERYCSSMGNTLQAIRAIRTQTWPLTMPQRARCRPAGWSPKLVKQARTGTSPGRLAEIRRSHLRPRKSVEIGDRLANFTKAPTSALDRPRIRSYGPTPITRQDDDRSGFPYLRDLGRSDLEMGA